MIERCENCRFFEAKMCRRYPPVFYKHEYENGYLHEGFSWPDTLNNEWCGEWQAKGEENG